MGEEKKETPQAQPKWEREEQVLLVVEYFANKNDRLLAAKSDIFLSNFLRMRAKKLGRDIGEKYRNVWGIQSQRENLSHFDPDYKGERTGHESVWMESKIKEYITDSNKMIAEAYEILKKYIAN